MAKVGAWTASAALVAAIVWAAAGAACGGGGNGSSFAADDDAGAGGPDGTAGPVDGGQTAHDSGDLFNDSSLLGPDVVTTLTIVPANPTVDVTIKDGVVTVNAPVAFQAQVSGTNVNAAWLVDRGEIGAIDAAKGTFTASGGVAGVAKVTANYGAFSATTNVTVHIHASQNGAPSAADAGADGGVGGVGGVGGEGNGGQVPDPGIVGRLQNEGNPPTGNDYGQLYPYDKTVWPRGLFAPLLQWQTTHTGTYVYIHLTEANYEFQGYYSVDGLAAPANERQPIDGAAWKQATYSNAGELLHVEIKFYSRADDKVYGPMKEDWTIAPGVLKGTVYYNSYNSRVVGNANGAVLAIKPGATAPSIAVPGTEGKCFVCHSVSADGTTLFAQDNTGPNGDYQNGGSYDLKSGSTIATYTGTAGDGTTNDRKFLWSGVYPDGSFAMASARYTREAWQENSVLFSRKDGTSIDASGWSTAVKSATTPVFSDDGTKLAFNFWEGAGANGVTAGGGHSLAVMDFSCGAPAGSKTCGAPPYAFSNLRELYRDATGSRWIGWPAFLPDGKGLVFQNTTRPGIGGPCDTAMPPVPNPASNGNCLISTWAGAQAELWLSDVPSSGASSPVAAQMLNGLANGVAYVPRNANHPNDEVLNYEPTVNPIASGGYYWVVFTSRRMYGNVAAGDPYDNGDGTYPVPKKLWVAAIDINAPAGKDASHPAFYLPGQELNAGNMRGYWVVDPCHPNGQSCETGDECCGGYCRTGDGGALVCSDQPMGCSNLYEKCGTDGECCGAGMGIQCINGRCAQPTAK